MKNEPITVREKFSRASNTQSAVDLKQALQKIYAQAKQDPNYAAENHYINYHLTTPYGEKNVMLKVDTSSEPYHIYYLDFKRYLAMIPFERNGLQEFLKETFALANDEEMKTYVHDYAADILSKKVAHTLHASSAEVEPVTDPFSPMDEKQAQAQLEQMAERTKLKLASNKPEPKPIVRQESTSGMLAKMSFWSRKLPPTDATATTSQKPKTPTTGPKTR